MSKKINIAAYGGVPTTCGENYNILISGLQM